MTNNSFKRRIKILTLLSLGLMANLCELIANSIPNPLETMLNPPIVRSLVAKQTYDDGTIKYILLRFDGTNCLVKTSRNRDALLSTAIVTGDAVTGYQDNNVWILPANQEDILMSNWSSPDGTNSAVFTHWYQTLTRSDHLSRLGRAILSFGIGTPARSKISVEGDRFTFSDQDFDVKGKVTLSQSESGLYSFVAAWRKEQIRVSANGTPKVLSYKTVGQLSSENMLPTKYDLFEVGEAGVTQRIAEIEVLKAELSTKSLPEYLFSREDNVSSGFRQLIVKNKDQLIGVSVERAASARREMLFGFAIRSEIIRFFILGCMITVAIAFAVIFRVMKRRNNTN